MEYLNSSYLHLTITVQTGLHAHTALNNTTIYVLPLDTIQCTSMILRIQITSNLLHLRILLCVYVYIM